MNRRVQRHRHRDERPRPEPRALRSRQLRIEDMVPAIGDEYRAVRRFKAQAPQACVSSTCATARRVASSPNGLTSMGSG